MLFIKEIELKPIQNITYWQGSENDMQTEAGEKTNKPISLHMTILLKNQKQ